MYIRNSSGPSTDHCWTPLNIKTSTQSDKTPLIPTFCFLPFSHSVIQSRILPQMPWLRILRISLLYGTLSKALAKSKNTISTFSPISIQPVTLSRNSKRLVKHDRPLRKPCCESVIKWLSSRWRTRASLIMASKVLPIMLVKLTGR